jgi:homoserine kinase type II
MAELTPLTFDEARALAAAHGLALSSLGVVRGGSVNSNYRVETEESKSYFLRIYEEQAREGAEREARLVCALAQSGVPTPEPVPRLDGALLSEHAGKPVAIFPWVDGKIVCQRAVTAAHASEVGAALGRVHLSGAPAEHAGRFNPKDLSARLDHVERVAPELGPVVSDVRRRLAHWVSRRDPTLPRGPIHGDLFRDNVLWKDQRIAALIDFESASNGVYAYDLMVTVLAWCFGDRFELSLVRALVAGYCSVRSLTPSERAALGSEAALAALRFATTRLTDYELRARPPLRDYRRFLERLDAIEAGVLDDMIASCG